MAAELPPDYPVEWETHAVLADGAPVEVRPIRPSDRSALDAFHKRQSPESIYFRFFQHRPELTPGELDHFTRIDYVDRMAFVALLGGELVAVARYETGSRDPDPEIAFFVDDDHHGRGLATLLLEYLAAAARSRGLTGFTASVLSENYRMLSVFRRAGFGVRTRFEDGIIAVDLDIALTAETAMAIAGRTTRSRSRSVARLLAPSSVAVVGAGRRPGSVGHELLRQLLDGGFTGALHPVNSRADEVLGLAASPSLAAVGQPIDLAVVAVRAESVMSVVEEAAVAGVGGLLIVSSGFSEAGAEGDERERQLVATARSNGMRIIGPNAFGLVNTAEEVRLRALFLPVGPEPGRVGLMSQSGPLGSAVLDHMRGAGVGISSFVAAGNRADVSVNDLLDYWFVDDGTDVVMLYVENFGNLRTFARSARTVSAHKPIVTVRPPDENLHELLAQSGVIVVDGVGELADVARVASQQALPRGRRVAIVANAASVARLSAAACRRHGLEPVVPASIEQIDDRGNRAEGTVLVADVDTVSVGEAARPSDYEQIVVAAAMSEEVDVLLVAVVPTLDLSLEDLARLLERIDRSVDKPVIAVGLIGEDRLRVSGVPVFSFPDEAARSLGHLVAYSEWRQADAGLGPEHDQDDGAIEAEAAIRPMVVDLLDGSDEVTLSLWSPSAPAALAALGVPVAPWHVVGSVDEARAAAGRLGYPVVLKVGGGLKRTVGELGGTAIDLYDDSQLEGAFNRMLARRGPSMLPAVVQSMVNSTGDARLELVQDRDLGAYVRLGLGGAVGTKVGAVVRRFLPLAVGDEAAIVDELAAALPIDDAARAVIEATVARLALVASVTPELSMVSLDPLLVAGQDVMASDFIVTLRPWIQDPLAGVRRL